mmetsp:Transcript_3365/g.4736  ORF Transcript_3365/g.4736 Transcript_3365/m.4736 type:complete len:497 (-) Transcript_3365:419-1909(-)
MKRPRSQRAIFRVLAVIWLIESTVASLAAEAAISPENNNYERRQYAPITSFKNRIQSSYSQTYIATIDRFRNVPNSPLLHQAQVQKTVEESGPLATATEEIKIEQPQQSSSQKYLVVKIVLFLYYGSLGSLMPYLPVYYHSLGIPDKKIGQLGAICPAVNFIISPLWGALADKTGQLKTILIFTFISSVALRCSMLLGRSFLWVAFVIFTTAIMNAPVRPLLDSSVMNMLTHKKDYGRQRLFGQFGFGVFSFLVGPMMARSGMGYRGAFLLHALVSVPTLLILCWFKPAKQLGPKKPTKFREGIRLLSRNSDAVIFFSMVFAIGLSSGVIENFAYKRLRELGGGGNVMGVSRLVSSLMGVPMFYFSGNLTKSLSVMGVLMFSLVSYITRFFIYASIKNPWHALPAEALRGVTFAGMWASSTYYAHKIAPTGMEATMLGFLNGIYGGVGQSLGSLIGGGLSSRFGTSTAFFCIRRCRYFVVGAFWGLLVLPSKSNTT